MIQWWRAVRADCIRRDCPVVRMRHTDGGPRHQCVITRHSLSCSRPVVTMTSMRRHYDVFDVTLLLLMLSLDAGRTSPSSSLDYCHRLDDHPPRLYATKTAYDEVRARDLEARQSVVATDDDSLASSTSGASKATNFAATDDYSCQR